MNRIAHLQAKAKRPGQLMLTLRHLLSMRTPDILTGVLRQRLRRALWRGHAAPGVRRSTVKLARAKCLENPLDCAACLRHCPQGVFFTYPRHRQRGQVCEKYELVTAFKSRCTGCGVCVDACPRGALRLL